MLGLAISVILTCKEPIKINETNEPWTEFDNTTLKRCQVVCYTDEYYKDTRCLKRIIKRPERHYNCICGVQERNYE